MANDLDVAKRYMATMHSAKSRNLSFDISFAEFKRIFNTKKCFYTGKRLVHGHNFSLDRVNNELGYVSGNVVACDETFNKLKANLTIEQINAIYFGIEKHGRNKKENK